MSDVDILDYHSLICLHLHRYEGECLEGRMEGEGTMTWLSGVTYTGDKKSTCSSTDDRLVVTIAVRFLLE